MHIKLPDTLSVNGNDNLILLYFAESENTYLKVILSAGFPQNNQ